MPRVWRPPVSPTGRAVLEGLRATSNPELQILATLAADQSRSTIVRGRMAVFASEVAAGRLSLARAAGLANGNGYFPAVVRLRIAAWIAALRSSIVSFGITRR